MVMKIETKADILAVLRMPYEQYLASVVPYAKQVHVANNDNQLTATAMLGFSNICKNRCLYCGMRAGNTGIKRYRIDREDVVAAAATAAAAGFERLFLISGEDPKYGFDDLLHIVDKIKALGFISALLVAS